MNRREMGMLLRALQAERVAGPRRQARWLPSPSSRCCPRRASRVEGLGRDRTGRGGVSYSAEAVASLPAAAKIHVERRSRRGAPSAGPNAEPPAIISPRKKSSEMRGGTALAWMAAWLTGERADRRTRYETRDPDSQLYAGISARLVDEPVSRWKRAQWWGFCQRGTLLRAPGRHVRSPALLGRPYPAEQPRMPSTRSIRSLPCLVR